MGIGWFAAQAAASSVGVGIGPAIDLKDRVEAPAPTVIGPGPYLVVPVRLTLTPGAALRVSVNAAYGHGRDLVSWDVAQVGRVAHPVTGDGRPGYPYSDPDEWAKFVSLGALVGPEVRILPHAKVSPTLSFGVGAALVHTFHNLEISDLFDREKVTLANLQNPSTFDPYTRQIVFATDLAAGVATGPLWAELGYSVQNVGVASLRKTAPALAAAREAYRWNAARLTLGIAVPIGPKPLVGEL